MVEKQHGADQEQQPGQYEYFHFIYMTFSTDVYFAELTRVLILQMRFSLILLMMQRGSDVQLADFLACAGMLLFDMHVQFEYLA